MADNKLNIDAPPSKYRWLRIMLIPVVIWGLLLAAIGAYILIAKPFAPQVPVVSEADHVDNRPLEIEVVKPIREVFNPSTEVTVIANKEINMKDSNRVSLLSLGKLDKSHYYVVLVKNLGVEVNKLTVKLEDEVGNFQDVNLEITRAPFSFPPGFDAVTPLEEAEYVLDGDDLKADVGKKLRLLEDYEPADLLDLNKEKNLGLYTLNNAMLRSEAAFALKAMLDDLATATGKYVTIASGYRSFTAQIQAYSGWVRELGQVEADQVSARPGHSEHQLGTTVDFVSDETAWKITNQFGDTVAGKWLADNCAKYGFDLPYRTDQTVEGGYQEESWHFRYVGKD